MTAARRALALFDEDLARRARVTNEAHRWWPCRAGCDACCRRLADVPRVSEVEWSRLAAAIDALEGEVRGAVRARLEALVEAPPAEGEHVVCPMLDREAGTCLVYEARPAACRAYGYYARRADVLACELVTTAVAAHPDEDVVWGNHAALDDDLARRLGDAKPITTWYAATR